MVRVVLAEDDKPNLDIIVQSLALLAEVNHCPRWLDDDSLEVVVAPHVTGDYAESLVTKKVRAREERGLVSEPFVRTWIVLPRPEYL